MNRYGYDAFGNTRLMTETVRTPFRFTGEQYDSNGLGYLRARYYDPANGRFLSRDSYLGKTNEPISLNRYTYCSNNPVVYIDPTGHITICTLNVLYENADYESVWSRYVELTAKIENERAIIEGDYSFWDKLTAKDNLNNYNYEYQLLNELLIIRGSNYSQEDKDRAKETIANLQNEKAFEFLGAFEGGPAGNSIKIIKNNKMANEIAQKPGYKGAEDLKKAFVGRHSISRFNMKYDSKTGEIILESVKDSSVQIPTGLFIE